MKASKRLLSEFAFRSGLTSASMYARRAILGKDFVYGVSYHDTPPEDASALEDHLAYYSKHFSPVSERDLAYYFKTGEWSKPKPGLIISFDDGLRSNFDVASKILERYNFTGWFFIPTAFIDSLDSVAFASKHSIQCRYVPPDHRIAMTWNEIRELDSLHVIGSHTVNHMRLGPDVADSAAKEEVDRSSDRLLEVLGHRPASFCWVGGEESAYSRAAATHIRNRYQFAFMTNFGATTQRTDPMHIQRSHTEAHWPRALHRTSVSGLLDLKYRGKRERVNRTTSRAS